MSSFCCLLARIYNYRYLHKRFYYLRISNIIIFRLLTNTNIEYIRSLHPDWIQISNIFVLCNLALARGVHRAFTWRAWGMHGDVHGMCTGHEQGMHWVYMGRLLSIHGACMGCARSVHRACTGSTRGMHGACTGHAWGMHGPCKGHEWVGLHRPLTGHSCVIHGACTG